MRKRIAERLKEAQNTAAMLTTFNEIDMAALMDLRSEYKDAFEKKHGAKLGYMSAFVKASTVALQEQPEVNAFIDDGDIIYRDYVDVSVAVSTPKGLFVPAIRGCENMNFAAIEKTIVALGDRARKGELTVEEMQGGTFTISNGGVFGSLLSTPIINMPQSAILGMHIIQKRPVVVKDQIVIRPMMYVALSYDHRLIDGREAVTFLRRVKTLIEDPRRLLLEIDI
jgi:2-oxoglutarate dehydrogenase E2 component (dihydrolipoamide succinyltransferase)